MPTLRLSGGRNSRSAVDHDRLVAEKNIARVGCLQAGDHAQGGGLAAAARAEQSEDLAVVNIQRKIFDRRLVLPG